MDEIPRISVLLQYFRMASRISMLAGWKRCPGVQLLVNADSREQGDLQWLQTPADHVLFSPNIHELRGYSKLAAIAAAPILLLVQDDMPPPRNCTYLDHMEELFDTPHVAVVGWRTYLLRAVRGVRRVHAQHMWRPNTSFLRRSTRSSPRW